MRTVNITFQATKKKTLPWDKVPIVYTMKNVPENKNVVDVSHCISTMLGCVTVRIARLFLDDELTPTMACRYNAQYFTACKNT